MIAIVRPSTCTRLLLAAIERADFLEPLFKLSTGNLRFAMRKMPHYAAQDPHCSARSVRGDRSKLLSHLRRMAERYVGESALSLIAGLFRILSSNSVAQRVRRTKRRSDSQWPQKNS